MKKIVSVFLLVICFFSFVGCSNKNVITNVSSLSYLDNSSKENIAYNLSLAANEIKGFSFEGTLKVKDKEYDFNGEAIVNESIKDSIIHINYDKNNLYVKNRNVYIGYFYKNSNIVVKDSFDNFLKEIKNKEVEDIVKLKGIKDINYEKISELVVVEGNGYSINCDGMIVKLNEYYLPISFEYSKDAVSIILDFSYEKVSINVPFIYELFNSSLEDIKDLLGSKSIEDFVN